MPAARRRPPVHEQMLGLISAYWNSQLVYVAARLGIADVLADGPRTAEQIAKKVGAHAPYLYRVLRALAGLGVFAEDAKGRFRLTPLGQTLRSDRPGSLRDFAHMMIDDHNWNGWGALLHGVQTGEWPWAHVYGKPHFDWLAEHPEKERVFAASMASLSSTENTAIAGAYPFGKLTRLVDVGGAHGHLLATILRRHKKLRGVLFDQPQVVAAAEKAGFVTAPGVRERCERVGGSFFEGVPAGADGYLMKYILHDWDDEKCTTLLRHCRAAMAPGGRVLAVEHVIVKGNAFDWAKLLDINMLVLPGGQERTREQFRALFAGAGLKLVRVHRTASPVSLLEAVAA